MIGHYGGSTVNRYICLCNGTCFTSSDFAKFTRRNHICHLKTAPYHPSSNGLAKRAVQTFKTVMKKQLTGTVHTKLSRFLFHYRLTPRTTTGVAPAELMLKQRPRSHLDLIVPDLKKKVTHQQWRQNSQHDITTRQRTFRQDELVMVRGFHKGPKDNWLPGSVVGIILTKLSSPMAKLYEDMLIIFVLDRVTVSLFQRMMLMIFQFQSPSSHLLVQVHLWNFAIHRGIVDLQSVFRLKEGGM